MDTGGSDLPAALLTEAAERALRARGVEAAELSVAFLDDDAIRRLNREHLGHDRTTDVLSFALWVPGEPTVVGDVYVGADQARRQAVDAGVDPVEEAVRLVVHGTLHVTGMDHPADPDDRPASPMYRLQERLVTELMDEGHGAP